MRTSASRSLSEQQVAGLLNGLRRPAAVLGPDYSILATNHAYCEQFERSAHDVLGARCYEISHRYDRPCDQMGERCPVQCAVGTRSRCSVLHEHHTRNGPTREEVVIQPLADETGKITAFLETLRALEVSGGRSHDYKMVGTSPAFLRMVDLIGRVAPSDIHVLLLGDSGTGKELAARSIHQQSLRSRGAFVPVDCSGLAETLFESELLGHEKGAFTGATHAKKGLVEAAAGGTLFLDEVGDVPLSQQVKLLRILESGVYRRVGSVEQRQADFRLICATHRDLPAMVERGDFRRDLYYRISAFPVRLPPLRERLEDLPLLCDRLLQRIEPGRPYRVAPETLEILRGYGFPGNVRELLNILQRACLLAEDHTIDPEHLSEECLIASGLAARPLAVWERGIDLEEGELLSLSEVEERYLRWIAERYPGDRADLARHLGLSERTLYRKLAALRDEPDPN